MRREEYLQEVARLALSLPEAEGFALAGGGAMIAHGLVDRPTYDVDLFGTAGRSIPTLGRALTDALTAAGSQVTVLRSSETFVQLGLSSPDGALSTSVELALDYRLHPPVRLDVGPVLSAEDVAADKTLALWGRAEARDLVDVNALAATYGREQLLRLAAAKDPGFDPALLPDALRTAAARRPEQFTRVGVTGDALLRLQQLAHDWAAELTAQRPTEASAPGEQRPAAQLAAEAHPAPLTRPSTPDPRGTPGGPEAARLGGRPLPPGEGLLPSEGRKSTR